MAPFRTLGWRIVFGTSLSAAALVGACGGSKATGGGPSGAGGMPTGGGSGHGAGGSTFVGGGGQGLDVEPTPLQTITVNFGQQSPTVMYSATLGGSPVSVGWGVDKGNVGTVSPATGTSTVFTPTGTTGGMVTVQAGYNGQLVQRQVMIKLTGSQNGGNAMNPAEQAQMPTMVSQLSAGGGVGGVGGEGLGPAVMDMPTLNALGSPTSNGQAQMLAFLYPYDKTVWPRGMLAPLLMWSSSIGDADAIKIDLKSQTGSFSWSGIFGRPAILMAETPPGKYIRSPIPQDVWDAATNTVSGPNDKLTVSLTIALGGMGYGPISETWTVAAARLTGTVYYNSYGTQYVKNWVNLDSAGNPVGAAILGVRSGDTAPTLIVGQNSPLDGAGHPTDDTGCRVCHVVASKGRWLLTQSEQGNPGDGRSFLYDLSQTNVPGSAVQLSTEGTFGWAALTGDASYALTNEVNPSSSNPAIGTSQSSFWNFLPTQPPLMMSPTTMPATATLNGLPAGVAAGYPSYSPDDKMVAYMDATGSTADVKGPIVVASYAASTQTFSNVQMILSPATGQRIGYPVFLPDNSGILFETQVRTGGDTVMVTRNGARSELWWANLGATPMPVALDGLNGKGYLPIGANDHGSDFNAPDPQYTPGADESMFDDTSLNYEPTVLPVVAGGYAWVVFTSRRLYGNQLTAVPWQSWPPSYNTRDLGQATVKKLWVAAIDLSAPAGSDPSHPAFYLPAQEILAGNSRGFWVLDPCKADGMTCQSGDQCCNGVCTTAADGGLVCGSTTTGCSGVQDKCTTAADCCDPTNKCINGFCAQVTQ